MTPKQQQFVSSGGLDKYRAYQRRKNTATMTFAGATAGFASGLRRAKGRGLPPAKAMLKRGAVGAVIGASMGLGAAVYDKHMEMEKRKSGR